MLCGLFVGCDGLLVGERVGLPAHSEPSRPTPMKPAEPVIPEPEPEPRETPRTPLFSCDPSATPPAQPLRRLSRTQLKNVFRALVDRFAPSNATAIWAALEPTIDQLPRDIPQGSIGGHGGFFQLDQAVQQEHADVLYRLGTALGQELTSTPARRTEAFTACATNASSTDDDACLDAFLRAFGASALRRPLSTDEVAFFRQVKRSDDASAVAPAVLADAVNLLVQSPELFFEVEVGTETSPLTAHELAAKVALTYWQAPPDDALLAAAASGSVLTIAGYRAELERVVASPKAQPVLDDFFLRWWQLETVPELDVLNGTRKYQAYVGADVPGPDTREAVVDDALAAARDEFSSGGSLSTLLTNRKSFAKDPLLARIYGVAPWSGVGAPPTFASPARSGLLSRAAFLVTGAPKTRPIIKGARIRQALLCEALPQPPANAASIPVEPSPRATTRERVELVTEAAGSACAGCHKPLLNPLGFASENFDGLGRERTLERIFDDEGALLAERPVRTDGVPQVLLGDRSTANTIADVTRLVDESGRMQSCFARMQFRYGFGRSEVPADGCSLARLEALSLANAPLREVWLELGSLPAFTRGSVR